ncbi:MAG: membrane protein insertion efficiency factor YidD [Elusimicrobiota bacterium]
MRKLLLGILGILRPIRAVLLPPSCRFRPTCSAYAVESLERFELRHAVPMILRRLLRCHPFDPGGNDPVRPPSAV